MNATRTTHAAGALLALLLLAGAFAVGRVTAPQAEPLYVPTRDRVDCLEVRLVPDEERGELVVQAWLFDGDGSEVWTRQFGLMEPLAVLWDGTAEGQEALDMSHWSLDVETNGAEGQP